MSAEPILITGVGRRVGLHLAHSFLDRGIPVIGTYRTQRPSLEALAQKGAELYSCDFDDVAQISALTTSIMRNHGSLRAIIHNASDWLAEHKDLASSEVMQRMFQVHVNAPYMINLALESLLEACNENHADIIHVGDYVSSRGSKKHIAYAASKAAQDNLTQSFAAKLAPRVKVNSLAPALVIFNPDDDPDYRHTALGKNLMQREAGLDEFQHAVDYLLQSRYVTGRVLPIDGGRHLC
jgi:dihydromonapterin reductase/dihydrofolate reductase